MGANLPNAVIEHNRKANSDGFGLMWREPGQGVRSEKFGPDKFEQFRKLLKSIDKQKVEYAAHFRTATHGKPCEALAHPFAYEDPDGEEVLLMHNGIINIKTEKNESDTLAFVRGVISQLDAKWWKNAATKWLVESSVGWSRLLLMSKDETIVLNASDWRKLDGFLYSTAPLPAPFKLGPKFTAPASLTKHTSGDTRYYDFLQTSSDSEEQDWLDDTLLLNETWTDHGHRVRPISGVKDKDNDTSGAAACSTCDAEGEYYMVGGEVYIDIDHERNTHSGLLLPAWSSYSENEDGILLPN